MYRQEKSWEKDCTASLSNGT